MPATQRAHLQVDQGSTFNAQIDLQSYMGVMFDLQNMTIEATMKKSYQSLIEYPFETSVVDSANGSFLISMHYNDTALIDAGRYVYDIVITSPTDERFRVIEGVVTVRPGVTTL
jgi:hypothetical protein